MDLASELSYYTPIRLGDRKNSFILHDSTPSHNFSMAMSEIDETGCFVIVSSRDFFDADLATMVR